MLTLKNEIMKKLNILIVLFVCCNVLNAQKYMTQNGVISFFSSTPVEDIEAINNQVSAVVNAENGEIAAVLLMKAFNFEKALMQEHFNEKFVESDKFPKSMFKGQILNFNALDLKKEREVSIKGDLTIHGVTKQVEVVGVVSKNDSTIELKIEFDVKPEDYKINIPGPVREKIAKSLEVNVNLIMSEM